MATCADCVHVEACHEFVKGLAAARGLKLGSVEEISAILQSDDCEHFKERARFVELPCKVGDSVFTIDKKENIQECIVINVNCKTQMTLNEKPWIDFVIVTEPVDDSLPFPMIFTYSIAKNQILFLTKESAEQALKERESHGQSEN